MPRHITSQSEFDPCNYAQRPYLISPSGRCYDRFDTTVESHEQSLEDEAEDENPAVGTSLTSSDLELAMNPSKKIPTITVMDPMEQMTYYSPSPDLSRAVEGQSYNLDNAISEDNSSQQRRESGHHRMRRRNRHPRRRARLNAGDLAQMERRNRPRASSKTDYIWMHRNPAGNNLIDEELAYSMQDLDIECTVGSLQRARSYEANYPCSRRNDRNHRRELERVLPTVSETFEPQESDYIHFDTEVCDDRNDERGRRLR